MFSLLIMQELELLDMILYLRKTSTLQDVIIIIIIIKLVLNKDQNHYCYNIFLEKSLDQLAKE